MILASTAPGTLWACDGHPSTGNEGAGRVTSSGRADILPYRLCSLSTKPASPRDPRGRNPRAQPAFSKQACHLLSLSTYDLHLDPGIWIHVSSVLPSLTVQPRARDSTCLGISLAFSKVILLKSTSWGCCEESLRTIGKTLIDFI